MCRGLSADKPESVVVKILQEEPLGKNDPRMRVEFAALKHGTEFHMLSGLLLSDGIIAPIADFEHAAEAVMAAYRDPTKAGKLGIRFPR